jgi:hypothetical protein
VVPFTIPGGNPVIALPMPGLIPRSPLMMVDPVLVTALEASTPKVPAVPRLTVATAAPATVCVAMTTAMTVPMTRHAATKE